MCLESKGFMSFTKRIWISATPIWDRRCWTATCGAYPACNRSRAEINTPEHKKFIWTVGSFLVDYCKRHATPEQLEKMDEAIRLGYFRWHGLAVTSHTGCSPRRCWRTTFRSAGLDREYGVHTIAAKMTDVPGHTIALRCARCQKAGIRYLHIGVNPSSRVPRVPEVFPLAARRARVIVHYSAQYGQAISIPGFDEALGLPTNDNRGPQDAAYPGGGGLARIQAKYPGAVVESLDAGCVAASLEKNPDRLPVVEEDRHTWIHGVGSDPYKVCRYKALVRAGARMARVGPAHGGHAGLRKLHVNLMLIAEHTWGMDFKKYLRISKTGRRRISKRRAARIRRRSTCSRTATPLSGRHAGIRSQKLLRRQVLRLVLEV